MMQVQYLMQVAPLINWLDCSIDHCVGALLLKQQILKFYLQIQRTVASSHICVSQQPVTHVKASFCA